MDRSRRVLSKILCKLKIEVMKLFVVFNLSLIHQLVALPPCPGQLKTWRRLVCFIRWLYEAHLGRYWSHFGADIHEAHPCFF